MLSYNFYFPDAEDDPRGAVFLHLSVGLGHIHLLFFCRHLLVCLFKEILFLVPSKAVC